MNGWRRGVNTLKLDSNFGGETFFTVKISDEHRCITRWYNPLERSIVPVWEGDGSGYPAIFISNLDIPGIRIRTRVEIAGFNNEC